MIETMARAAMRELAARPTLAFTIASLVGTFVVAYVERSEELRRFAADLASRADELEARAAYARTGEQFAEFDAERWQSDGEIAQRLYGPGAPVERVR